MPWMARRRVEVSTGTPRARRARPVGGPARGDARTLLDHRRCRDAAMAQGEQGGEGDQLAADNDRPAEGPDLLQIDELLQGAGGDHAPGPVAADEPRAARRFAHPEGQQDGSGLQSALAMVRDRRHRIRPPGSMAVTVVRLRISMPACRGGEAARIGRAARAAGGTRAGQRPDGRNAAARRPRLLRARSARFRVMPSSASRCAAGKTGGPAAEDGDLMAHACVPLGNPARRPSASAATLALQ